MHVDNYGNTFDRKNVEIMDRRNSKNTRECLEAWHSGQTVVNKHIKIDPIHQPIIKIMDKYRRKNQVKGRYNQSDEVDNDRLEVNNGRSPLPPLFLNIRFTVQLSTHSSLRNLIDFMNVIPVSIFFKLLTYFP